MTGSATPGIIAAAAIRTERRLVGILRDRRALSSSTAVPLDAPGGLARRRLRRLVAAGAVHEAQPGRYWLDEAAWAARERRRHRFKLMALLVLLVGIAVLFLSAG
ncbi:MAG TPA: hypothetical protein VFX50_02575 [Gemmatimonadales bacterium]|nr:hypothetical protein [Gemmatimonadales bacterium]